MNRITADSRFEITQAPLQQKPTGRNNPNKRQNSQSPLESNQFHMNYYHLKINNLQSYDENEYSCETTIARQNNDQQNLQSLINLKVTRMNLIKVICANC